jgi:hypothetical protein
VQLVEERQRRREWEAERDALQEADVAQRERARAADLEAAVERQKWARVAEQLTRAEAEAGRLRGEALVARQAKEELEEEARRWEAGRAGRLDARVLAAEVEAKERKIQQLAADNARVTGLLQQQLRRIEQSAAEGVDQVRHEAERRQQVCRPGRAHAGPPAGTHALDSRR